jgi:hypothetical protein
LEKQVFALRIPGGDAERFATSVIVPHTAHCFGKIIAISLNCKIDFRFQQKHNFGIVLFYQNIINKISL